MVIARGPILGERVVFTEEGQPSQYLKVIASGELDDFRLEELEVFVKRQRKRLKASVVRSVADMPFEPEAWVEDEAC
jgi:hypothetical protein